MASASAPSEKPLFNDSDDEDQEPPPPLETPKVKEEPDSQKSNVADSISDTKGNSGNEQDQKNQSKKNSSSGGGGRGGGCKQNRSCEADQIIEDALDQIYQHGGKTGSDIVSFVNAIRAPGVISLRFVCDKSKCKRVTSMSPAELNSAFSVTTEKRMSEALDLVLSSDVRGTLDKALEEINLDRRKYGLIRDMMLIHAISMPNIRTLMTVYIRICHQLSTHVGFTRGMSKEVVLGLRAEKDDAMTKLQVAQI